MAEIDTDTTLDTSGEEKQPTQVAYRPRSQGKSIETVCPPTMATPLAISLDRVEAVTGQSIDEFVSGRLGIDAETLFERYAAEQIDSLAITYLNQDRDRPTLIANDTGTGKGRIVSGVIAPVLAATTENGEPAGKIAVFVTAKPDLYVDMLARDMVDTGIRDQVRPFFTNSGLNLELTAPDGTVTGTIETPKGKQQEARIQALIEQFQQTGTIGEYNCIFTTADQLKDKGSLRRKLLETIAPKATFVLDECDLVGGASGPEPELTRKQMAQAASGADIRSVSKFVTGSVLPHSDSYVLLSATAFKDPHVLTRLMYPKSEIRETGLGRETLAERLSLQGIPAQQDFTNKLALSGELVRLEKSMEGITFQAEPVPVDLAIVDKASNIMAKLVQFDRAKQAAVELIKEEYAGSGEAIQASDGSEGRAAVDSVNFTSTAFNFQQQFLFFLKADSIAQKAIESIEAGRKPEVIFFNTMQSVIEENLSNKRDSIEQQVIRDWRSANPDERIPEAEIESLTKERYQDWLRGSPAPEITLDIGGLLERQLEKARMVTIKDAYGDRERHYLTDAELGDEAVALDNEIRLLCQNTDWSSVKISGVDAILQQVSAAGYTMGEMSGRSVGIDYSDGTPRYRSIDASDPEVRAEAKNGYNNGDRDGLIANISTGWSAHASRSVSDQRQREAILAQAHPDGNKLIQSLGRVNRVGQVDPAKHEPDWTDENGNPGWGKVREQHGIRGAFGLPVMTMVYADGVAYEERITANINRKMASLNANTTGTRSSGVNLGDVDFMNSYGDQVAWDLMTDDPELHEKMDFPLGEPSPSKEKLEGAMMKVTGRSLLLPLDEQQQLFDTLKQNFTEYIAQREAIGESPMESKTLDMRAKTLARVELAPAKSDSLFAGATYVEVVQARSLRKPVSPLEVANQVRKSVGLEAVDEVADQEFTPIGEPRSLGQAAMESRVQALDDQVSGKIARLDENIAQKKARFEELQPDIQKRIDSVTAELATARAVDEPDELAIKRLEKSLKVEQRSLSKLSSETDAWREVMQKTNLSSQWEGIKARLELCPVGQPVRIADKELGSVYGVVTDVKRVEGIKNPLAGGAWKIKFSIADGARELTLKLSDINADKKVWVNKTETAQQFQPPFDRVPVAQMFDDLQKERFETRQIVTGNLLTSPVGKKYINFTNSQGQVRQGLLLPRGYDIEKALEKAPVTLTDRSHQEAFLDRPGAEAKTTDEGMNITCTVRSIAGQAQDGLLLEVPSGKRGGGKYYKDADLMALTHTGEFEKKGKSMQGFIPAERADAFFEVMERKFPAQNLAVFEERWKPTAREISGATLQTLEWFKEDQTLDLAAQELEISTEGIADRIATQKAQAQEKAVAERQLLAFQSGDLDGARPVGVAEKQEVQEHPDLEKLIGAFEQHFEAGNGFDRITEARKFAVNYLRKQHSDLDLTLTNKQVDECIEKSLVRVGRELTQTADALESFDQMVELYDRQPNLSSRTSTSIINQQYSTPVPIGRLVQQLGDITPETTVYEPTAGNGSLVTNADPSRSIVNELDPRRASELEAQGFTPTTHDATEYAPEKKSVERVILNPPFGRVSDPETGKPKRWTIELDDPAPGTRPYETSAIDHAISFKALSAMQDDGKAVLVLGAPLEQKIGSDSRDTYNEGQTRSFFYTLYNNYNVTDHFTVSGDLYGKQGTTYPIDVVVIDGRGKSELELPAVKSPPVYRSWEELREVMQQSVEQAIAAPMDQPQSRAAIATCTIPSAFGDIEARLFDAPEDYLRLEVEGAMVNWVNYPDPLLVTHIPRIEVVVAEPTAAVAESSLGDRAALQAAYPEYRLEIAQTAGRYKDSFLLVIDPDGWAAGSINLSEAGLSEAGAAHAYQSAAQLIERHEQKRQQPELVALRDEFPKLRFESEVRSVGQVVVAFDKATDDRVGMGLMAGSSNTPTPDKMEEFRGRLRDKGYGVVPAPAMTAAPLEGDRLKEAIVEYLNTSSRAGLTMLQDAMGYSKQSSTTPLSNPVNQALRELRDEGRVKVIRGENEPCFQLNAAPVIAAVPQTPPQISNVLPIDHLPTALKIQEPPTLQQMRDWLVDSKLAGRSEKHIERVRQLCMQMVEGTEQQQLSKDQRNPDFVNPKFTLSGKAWEALNQDRGESQALRTVSRSDLVEWYQKSKILNQSPEQLEHIKALGQQQIQGTAQESLAPKDRDPNFKNPHFVLERKDFLDRAATLLEYQVQVQSQSTASAGKPLGQAL